MLARIFRAVMGFMAVLFVFMEALLIFIVALLVLVWEQYRCAGTVGLGDDPQLHAGLPWHESGQPESGEDASARLHCREVGRVVSLGQLATLTAQVPSQELLNRNPPALAVRLRSGLDSSGSGKDLAGREERSARCG